jgi:hypothetical protein
MRKYYLLMLRGLVLFFAVNGLRAQTLQKKIPEFGAGDSFILGIKEVIDRADAIYCGKFIKVLGQHVGPVELSNSNVLQWKWQSEQFEVDRIIKGPTLDAVTVECLVPSGYDENRYQIPNQVHPLNRRYVVFLKERDAAHRVYVFCDSHAFSILLAPRSSSRWAESSEPAFRFAGELLELMKHPISSEAARKAHDPIPPNWLPADLLAVLPWPPGFLEQMQAFDDKITPEQRIAYLSARLAHGDEKALPEFFQAFEQNRRDRLRVELAIKDSEYPLNQNNAAADKLVPCLLQLVNPENDDLSQWATEALAHGNADMEIPALLESLKNPVSIIRFQSYRFLKLLVDGKDEWPQAMTSVFKTRADFDNAFEQFRKENPGYR